MPAISDSRQPNPALKWFATTAGQDLVAAETDGIAQVIAGCPALPWVWMGAPDIAAPEPGRRGLLLRRVADHPGAGRGELVLDGDLRCSLPLPLASETFGAILLQHALDDDVASDELLGECARVIAPGGNLWLATLNPWAPYRLLWARSGLRASGLGAWQARLRRAGFAIESVRLQWLGPHWRDGRGDVGVGPMDWLRGGLALTVNKRVHAAIPPRLVRPLRWQAGQAGALNRSSQSRQG